MSESGALVVVLPVLVALTAMAGVEDHVRPGVVQTGLVPPDLPRLTQHPVLVASLKYFHDVKIFSK